MKNFADSLLSKEQLKNVKGGEAYCWCGGAGPVSNPNPFVDCITICTGWSPWGNGLTGSSGGNSAPANNPYTPSSPCIPTTMGIGTPVYYTYQVGC